MKYEYPPSKHIQSYTPFDEATHFFCIGQIEFDTITVDCEFEVAYTHNCEIVVVLYLDHQNELDIFYNKEKEGSYTLGGVIQNTHFKRLIGTDKRYGYKVLVEDGFFRKLGGSHTPPIFAANSFQYKNKHNSIIENYEYRTDYIFEITGIDFNTDFMSQRLFPIHEDSPPLTLEVIYKQNRTYDNQPLARLRLPKDILFNGWTPEDLVDLWCALMSLAIGRDIRWTKMEYLLDDQVIYKWRYRSNVLGLNSFIGLISIYPLEFESTATVEFMKQCFTSIKQGGISTTLASQYTLAIRHYVTYRLMSYRVEDHARLVGTTVEELLTSWESDQDLKHERIVTDEELTKILEASKLEVYSIIKTFDGNRKRRDDIKNKVKYLLRKELPRFSFKERLKRYFSAETHQFEDDWYEKNVQDRLSHFTKARDKVVHTGKLPGEENKVKHWYYNNLLMILPLMVFAFFRYDGQYIDLVEYWKDGIQAPPSEEQDK